MKNVVQSHVNTQKKKSDSVTLPPAEHVPDNRHLQQKAVEINKNNDVMEDAVPAKAKKKQNPNKSQDNFNFQPLSLISQRKKRNQERILLPTFVNQVAAMEYSMENVASFKCLI